MAIPATASPQGPDISDWRPRPDPTALTTAAVDRASFALTASFEKDVKALKDLMEAEFRSRDSLRALLTDELKNLPDKIEKEVSAQQSLLVEKQNVIKADMAGMKELATALKSAADAGINAAFLAADKVVQSQYTAFKDTLDKTNDSIVLRIGGIEHQLETMREENRIQSGDIKDRVTRLETARTTGAEGRNEGRDARNTNTNAIAAAFVGLALLVSIAALFISSGHGWQQAQGQGQGQGQGAAIAVAPLNPSALAPPGRP